MGIPLVESKDVVPAPRLRLCCLGENNLVAGGTFGSGPFSFDQDGTIGNSVNPYSLTATYQITGGTDSTDFTGNMLLQPASVVQPVTEPASILLLGAGLAGLALSKIGGRPLV